MGKRTSPQEIPRATRKPNIVANARLFHIFGALSTASRPALSL